MSSDISEAQVKLDAALSRVETAEKTLLADLSASQERVKLLENIVQRMWDIRYQGCRFPDAGGGPCGNCEACQFTTETSCMAVEAMRKCQTKQAT